MNTAVIMVPAQLGKIVFKVLSFIEVMANLTEVGE